MFDYSNAQITELRIHFLNQNGNAAEVLYTESPVDINRPIIKDYLFRYGISPFVQFEDYSRFASANEHTEHSLKAVINDHFDQQKNFLQTSKAIANLIAQKSSHQGIKPGELLVLKVQDIIADDEMINAIAIIKSEVKQEFLQLIFDKENYTINAESGIQIDKLDKGCIIFNTRKDEGYVIASIDRTNSGTQAQFWANSFLNLTPLNKEYLHTEQYMNMAQTYLKHQLNEEIDLPKGSQLNILHQAGEFFKKESSFNEQEFQDQVLLGSPEIIDSFDRYKKDYSRELEVELPQQFSISNLAVRRSAKDFKSVLKLDKNFHVYIHGDRQMIEHGRDPDGRKYYKLYYENES